MDRPLGIALAVHRFDGRDVEVGTYGVVRVVGEGGECYVGDHLHDLLVAVAGLPDIIECFVGDVTVILSHPLNEPEGGCALGIYPLNEPEGGCALGILRLKTLRPLALFLAEALLLRHGGVDRQSVFAAMEVGDRHGDGLLQLAI